MKPLRLQIEDLAAEIMSQIDHGECFHEEDVFDELMDDLEDLKTLVTNQYERNKENDN